MLLLRNRGGNLPSLPAGRGWKIYEVNLPRRKAKKEDGGKGWKISFDAGRQISSTIPKEKHPSPSFGRNRGGNFPAGIEVNLPRRKAKKEGCFSYGIVDLRSKSSRQISSHPNSLR